MNKFTMIETMNVQILFTKVSSGKRTSLMDI